VLYLLNYLSLPYLFWNLVVKDEIYVIRYGLKKFQLQPIDIKNVTIKNLIVFWFIKIDLNNTNLILIGFNKDSFLKIENDLNAIFELLIKKYTDLVNRCFETCGEIYLGSHYGRAFLLEKLKSEIYQNYGSDILQTIKKIGTSFVSKSLDAEVKDRISKIESWVSEFEQEIRKFNAELVKKEMPYAKELAIKIGQRPPTEEQLEAIVTFENNNLLVASAGSGKSATLVNKVCYAIDRKYAKSEEVLILAYGKDAAIELIEKFKEIKDKNTNFEIPKSISTFHSLGAKIISNTKHRLEVAEWAIEPDKYSELLKSFANDLQSNPDFLWKFATLASLFKKQNAFGHKQQEYFMRVFAEIDNAWNLKTEVKKELNFLRTLKGEDVKSIEELIIANWYYMHSIDYKYEKETDYKNYRGETRKHKPDFFLPEYKIYHEHFGLNQDGTAPEFLGKDYLPRVAWKRKWYADEKLPFFETTSAQFRDGTLFTEIEAKLKDLNVSLQFKNNLDLEKAFNDGALESLLNVIGTAIKHIRSQGRTTADFTSNTKYKDQILLMFFDVVIAILGEYETKLRESQSLDFEGLLIEAAHLVEEGFFKHNFKLILVDEFQDISSSRLRLLSALVRQRPETIVFAVGDDWQGIYKFSGADLDIFVNFEKYVGKSKELYLTQTFRSNQGITSAAANFVQQNKLQKQKNATSSISTTMGTIEIIDHDSKRSIDLIIEDIVSKLVASQPEKKIKVFVLGRYNRSCPPALNKTKAKFRKSADIEFKTFHRSKGLEADYTILVGMNCDGLAFPSLKEDHPLLRVFVDNNDSYPFAEERRLFYVSLTRAKSKAFLLCEVGQRSVFVDELVKLNRGNNIIIESRV
jgi:DNA helicase-4